MSIHPSYVESIQRVRDYLDARASAGGLDHEQLAGHNDHPLLASDLRVVLALANQGDDTAIRESLAACRVLSTQTLLGELRRPGTCKSSRLAAVTRELLRRGVALS